LVALLVGVGAADFVALLLGVAVAVAVAVVPVEPVPPTGTHVPGVPVVVGLAEADPSATEA
jgi:hypothetical protein